MSYPRNRLVAALLISMAIHVASMVALRHDEQPRTMPDPVDPTFEVTLARSRPSPPPVEEAPTELSPPEPVTGTGVADHEAEPAAAPEPDARVAPTLPEPTDAESAPAAAAETDLRARVLSALVDRRYDNAQDAYTTEVCTPVEEVTLARDCAKPEPFTGADDGGTFAGLVTHSRGYEWHFSRDMERVDQLLAEASHLTVLDPSSPHEVLLVAEQRQHIREEILRIDRRYQGANLLRLVPMSVETFKLVREAVAD